jgi:hypothetical protein
MPNEPGLHALLTRQGAPCYLPGVDNARQKAAPLESHPTPQTGQALPEVLADCRAAPRAVRRQLAIHARRHKRIHACKTQCACMWARVHKLTTLMAVLGLADRSTCRHKQQQQQNM